MTDVVVRVAIGALRKALGDTAQTPRYIATAARRGYRFLAPVTLADVRSHPGCLRLFTGRSPLGFPAAAGRTRGHPPAPGGGVGAGAPGVAPDRVGDRRGRDRQDRRGRGIARGGRDRPGGVAGRRAMCGTLRAGEAYLPVLEALGQLCRGPGGERLVTLLRQHAPTWLVQMPWLLTATDRQQLARRTPGHDAGAHAAGVCRSRRHADGDDAAAPGLRRPALERLRDPGSAGAAGPAADAGPPPGASGPIDRSRRSCATIRCAPWCRTCSGTATRTELPLALLNAEAVAAYLAARFPRQQFPAALAPWLHQRTDGQPCFWSPWYRR